MLEPLNEKVLCVEGMLGPAPVQGAGMDDHLSLTFLEFYTDTTLVQILLSLIPV